MNSKIKGLFSARMLRELAVAAFAGITAYSLFKEPLMLFLARNWPGIAGCALMGGAVVIYALAQGSSIDERIAAVFKNVGVSVKVSGDEHLYPVLTHKHRASYGWKLLYTLPPGISESEILKHHRAIEIATKAEIEIYEKNSLVHIKAYTHDLPNHVKMPSLINSDGLTIGQSRAGTEELIVQREQHMLVAGETGCGKTNLLRVLAVHLANHDNVSLFVIDVKRNLGFLREHSWFACEHKEINRMVNFLVYEMDRRYAVFDQLGIDELNALPDDAKNDFPLLVVLIDEFAGISPALARRGKERDERSEAVFRIIDLMNRGRGAGVFCIIGVQRPDSEVMDSGMIKANMTCRFGFRTVDAVNSRIILDNPMAAALPQDTPGRCVFRGRDRLRQVQIYDLPLSQAKKMLPETPKSVPRINYGLRNGSC